MTYFRITKEQQRALAAKFKQSNNKRTVVPVQYFSDYVLIQHENWKTYRHFRKSILPVLGGGGAITVQWCSMWLCIETDGYTHS